MENSKNKIEEKVYTAGEVGSMLESIDSTMKMMSENYSNLASGQEEIKCTLNNLQDDMTEVKFELRQKVSVDEFQRLERRVTKLERLSLAH